MNLTATLTGIRAGRGGTIDTLKKMRQLVRDYKKNPRVRQLALKLVEDLEPKDWWGEAENIFEFVRDRVRYVKDVRGVETLHTPITLLKLGQGDCDDKAVLVCALLESIGHKTRFVAVGFAGGNFSHVYAEVLIGGEWIAMETTEPWDLGESVEKKARVKMVMGNEL